MEKTKAESRAEREARKATGRAALAAELAAGREARMFEALAVLHTKRADRFDDEGASKDDE